MRTRTTTFTAALLSLALAAPAMADEAVMDGYAPPGGPVVTTVAPAPVVTAAAPAAVVAPAALAVTPAPAATVPTVAAAETPDPQPEPRRTTTTPVPAAADKAPVAAPAPQAVTGAQLPFTGINALAVLAAGLLLVGTGVAVRRLAPRA